MHSAETWVIVLQISFQFVSRYVEHQMGGRFPIFDSYRIYSIWRVF